MKLKDIIWSGDDIERRVCLLSRCFAPFFLSFDTALPPREDYVQVDCVLKSWYNKCTEKEKIKMIVFKRMYKKN